MRDLFVFGVVVLSLPLAFRRPFIGLLLFSWLAYMRPQDLCWGFARDMRLSFYVGLTMIAGYFANEAGRRNFARWDFRTYCMVALLILTYVSTFLAHTFNDTIKAGLIEFTKIIAVALFTTGQVDSRQRLRTLIWTFALCLGFFGFKGGLIGILSGGNAIRRGPGGMMEDNNDFALALVMGLPILWYLALSERNMIIRRGTQICVGLTVITIILTHSRGGFLSMCVAFGVIAWRSRKLLQTMVVAGVAALLFFNFAPDSVLERLGTIQKAAEGEEDDSVGARFRAWAIGWRMIQHNPVLGVGHKNFRYEYAIHEKALFPGENQYFNHVAHNSYIQIWAEGGTPAFLIFVMMVLSVFFATSRLRRLSRDGPNLEWVRMYANMAEATMAGFLAGATFLNRGHFDLSYHMVAVVTALVYVARQEYAKGESHAAARTEQTAVAARPAARPVWGERLAPAGGLPSWSRAR